MGLCKKDVTDSSANFVQERRNSSVLAMELHLSCMNPSMLCMNFNQIKFTILYMDV